VTNPTSDRADLLARRRAPERRIDNTLQIPCLTPGAWRREFRFGVAAELHILDRSASGKGWLTLTCLHSVHVFTGRWTDLLSGFPPMADILKSETARLDAWRRSLESWPCRVGLEACAVNQAVIQLNVNRPDASRGGEGPRIRRGRRRDWSLQRVQRLCREDACVANINMMRRLG